MSGIIHFEFSPDGDRIVDSVTYPTIDGKIQNVKYEYTLDGDRVPVTGHTIDGDHHFPNSLHSWPDCI